MAVSAISSGAVPSLHAGRVGARSRRIAQTGAVASATIQSPLTGAVALTETVPSASAVSTAWLSHWLPSGWFKVAARATHSSPLKPRSVISRGTSTSASAGAISIRACRCRVIGLPFARRTSGAIEVAERLDKLVREDLLYRHVGADIRRPWPWHRCRAGWPADRYWPGTRSVPDGV